MKKIILLFICFYYSTAFAQVVEYNLINGLDIEETNSTVNIRLSGNFLTYRDNLIDVTPNPSRDITIRLSEMIRYLDAENFYNESSSIVQILANDLISNDDIPSIQLTVKANEEIEYEGQTIEDEFLTFHFKKVFSADKDFSQNRTTGRKLIDKIYVPPQDTRITIYYSQKAHKKKAYGLSALLQKRYKKTFAEEVDTKVRVVGIIYKKGKFTNPIIRYKENHYHGAVVLSKILDQKYILMELFDVRKQDIDIEIYLTD